MSTNSRYVALLRGINVGGRAKVAMADLRTTCEAIGCSAVSTYIQSGNVALNSSLGPARLRSTLEKAIAERLGVSPVVVIRTPEQLAALIDGQPFPDAEPASLHVAFLSEAPDDTQVSALAELDCAPEELAVRGDDVYFHLPDGLGRAKLPVLFGRRLAIPATIRNWRTVNKLREMSAR